jgi:hypothetical protein
MKYNPNRLIIFSSARSGGNLLQYLLNRYNSVKPFGEVFSRVNLINNYPNIYWDDYEIYTVSNEEIISGLEELYPSNILYIYRIHPIHFRFDYNKNLYDFFNPFKKILLYRENFLNKMVSQSIALLTNKWHYSVNDSIINYSNFGIYYDKDWLIKQRDILIDYYNSILDKYSDITIVKYEDLISNMNVDDIVSKLDIDIQYIGGDIETVYINPYYDNCSRILNINDFDVDEYTLKLKVNKYGLLRFD